MVGAVGIEPSTLRLNVRFGSKADPHVQSLIIASLREAIDVSSDRIDFPD